MPGKYDECGKGGVYSLITPRVIAWMKELGVPPIVRVPAEGELAAPEDLPIVDESYAEIIELLEPRVKGLKNIDGIWRRDSSHSPRGLPY